MSEQVTPEVIDVPPSPSGEPNVINIAPNIFLPDIDASELGRAIGFGIAQGLSIVLLFALLVGKFVDYLWR